MTLLMCPPAYFAIDYEINPWMHCANMVDRAKAVEQWENLYNTYEELGEEILLVAPHPGVPDMVFTANAGVVWKNHVVPARFHHPERKPEEPYFENLFRAFGVTLLTPPQGLAQEGAGDFLFAGDHLFCGYGFRTERATHSLVAASLGVEFTSLHLVNPSFYHLDTCFSPLDKDTALVNPEAFDLPSLEAIQDRIPRVIWVTPGEAAAFVCNAMTVDTPQGKVVVSSPAITNLNSVLAPLGFRTIGLPISEFLKAGGGVRCLTLPLI